MNMYQNVLLVGISTDYNAFQLALRVTPLKQNKNCTTGRDLMYGNLLWISLSGDFSDPVWATVESRLEGNVVIVQTCWEENKMTDAELVYELYKNEG